MNVHAAALAQSYPFDEQTSAFAGDVIGDLSQFPKRLSPKYFYDAAGSELFEQITVLPEYYPTRTELGILRSRGDEIASCIFSRMCSRPWRACSSAFFITSVVMPVTLMSIWSAVIPSEVPATLKSMSP